MDDQEVNGTEENTSDSRRFPANQSNETFITSKAMNQSEAIRNLEEQFQAIEKILTEEAENSRKSSKLEEFAGNRHGNESGDPNSETNDERNGRPSRYGIKARIEDQVCNGSNRASRSYKNHQKHQKLGRWGIGAVTKIDPNWKAVNSEETRNRDSSGDSNKFSPLVTFQKKVEPKSETWKTERTSVRRSTEPTLFIKQDRSAPSLKQMLKNKMKSKIKNFTIILNRKRKHCGSTECFENALKSFLKKPPCWNISQESSTKKPNNSFFHNETLKREDDVGDSPTLARRMKSNYPVPSVYKTKRHKDKAVDLYSKYRRIKEDSTADKGDACGGKCKGSATHQGWDMMRHWQINDGICPYAEDSLTVGEGENHVESAVNSRNKSGTAPNVPTSIPTSIPESMESSSISDDTNDADCNDAPNSSCTHKCEKRSTLRKMDDGKKTEVISDLVIPLHFVHLSEVVIDKNFENKSIESHHRRNYSTAFNDRSSDKSACLSNKQNIDKEYGTGYFGNKSRLSCPSQQRQVRNTNTAPSFDVVITDKRRSALAGKKILIDFVDNSGRVMSKPPVSETSKRFTNCSANDDRRKSGGVLKMRNMIVDLEGIDDERTTTYLGSLDNYETMQIQKPVYFRLSTPIFCECPDAFEECSLLKSFVKKKSCRVNNSSLHKAQSHKTITFGRTDKVSKAPLLNSFYIEIEGKKMKELDKITESPKQRFHLTANVRNDGIQSKMRTKAVTCTDRTVGRRKSYISSLMNGDLIYFQVQKTKRPSTWAKKKPEELHKKIDDVSIYDDLLPIEDEALDDEDDLNYVKDEDGDDYEEGEYTVCRKEKTMEKPLVDEPLYANDEESEGETPLEWDDCASEYLDRLHQVGLLPLGDVLRPPLNAPTSAYFANRLYDNLKHLRKVTVHPAKQKQHKKDPNLSKHHYNTTRPPLLPNYRMSPLVTDTIYFNKYSVKIGERTTQRARVTDFLNKNQIHEVRKFSRKFRYSASKCRDALRKIDRGQHTDLPIRNERKMKNGRKSKSGERKENSNCEAHSSRRKNSILRKTRYSSTTVLPLTSGDYPQLLQSSPKVL